MPDVIIASSSLKKSSRVIRHILSPVSYCTLLYELGRVEANSPTCEIFIRLHDKSKVSRRKISITFFCVSEPGKFFPDFEEPDRVFEIQDSSTFDLVQDLVDHSCAMRHRDFDLTMRRSRNVVFSPSPGDSLQGRYELEPIVKD